MRSWLKGWGKPEAPAAKGGHGGMNHGGTGSKKGSGDGGMAGMMSAKDMAGLKAAKGTEFERTFAQLMIAHHKGAVDMAKDEQSDGRNVTAKALAADVVKNQSAEVTQLQKILDRL
jgi:uncharacterized protein (DUF305 family)